MKFIDQVSLILASGKGGPGLVSFHREKFKPRGGPDGGDGGRGGDVLLKVNPSKNTLLDYRYRKKLRAEHGAPGQAKNCSGAAGADLILEVPPGTVVQDMDGNKIVDMSEISSGVYRLLAGGRGGKGNTHFKNSVNQAPDYAQPGEDGQELTVQLVLKLIADVGLVGFPNAGKSTLISRISASRPKIADYPFTTLEPNLGVVSIDEVHTFVVADVPGLIEGAHKGVGLGTQFLRHIERTRVLVHLVDVTETPDRDPWGDYVKINRELELYDKSRADDPDYLPLKKRPQIVALNKVELTSEERLENLRAQFASHGIQTRAISGVTGHGIKDLIQELATYLFEEKQ